MPTSKRIGSFSQKGFTRNFLSLMKDKQKSVDCCINPLTQIFTVNSSSITFSGSGTESDPLSAIAVASIGANNGLSLLAGEITLGQTVGAVGDPGKLLTDREIPMNGHAVFFGHNDGVDDIVGINNLYGISISNAAGIGIQMFFNGQNYQLYTPGPGFFSFGMASDNLQYTESNRWLDWSSKFTAFSLGGSIYVITGASAATFDDQCFTFVIDTASGPLTVDIDPVLTKNQIGYIKKKTNDANAITVTADSGLIFVNGTGVTSYVFSGAGQTLAFQSDGTNIYILSGGTANPNRRTITANTAVTVNDSLIIVDTVGGNVTITVDPSVLKNKSVKIKKKGTDTNSVIISATTGSLYADSGAQPTYTMAGPGASIELDTDSTNTFIS